MYFAGVLSPIILIFRTTKGRQRFMALYLVRHGETDYNRLKRFQSRTDVPLNDHGLAQARAVRDELRRRRVEFALARCSPLSRAVATARIILEGSGVALALEPAFVEISMGEFEGRFEDDLRQEYGEVYATWRSSHYTIAAPGGESIAEGSRRVSPALEQLKPSAITGNVIIVAHQAINMAIKAALTGRCSVDDARGFRQHNSEVDIWDVASGERLERFTVAQAPES